MIRMSEQQLQLMLKGGGVKTPPKRAATGKESPVVSACLKWLFARGFDPIRNNTGGAYRESTSKKTGQKKKYYIRFGKKDTGDIVFCANSGRWVEIECKAVDGKQSEGQIARQKHVEGKGGVYILARSLDDLEAMKAVILGSMGEMG